MKIERLPDLITIRYVPIAKWLTAVVGVLAIAAVAYMGFTRPGATMSLDDAVGSLLIAVLAVGTAYFSVFDFSSNSGVLAASTFVAIDSKEKFVQITYTRLYGRRVKRYYFYQADRFRSYNRKRLGVKRYYLALRLLNHRRLKLGVPLGRDKNATARLVRELNRALKPR